MEPRSGKVNVLNKGIPLCKGEIILLSDANAMYNKECVQKIIPHFMDSNVGCVAGEKRMVRRGEEISQNEGVYWKLESKIKQLEDKVSTVIGADGACYAIRKIYLNNCQEIQQLMIFKFNVDCSKRLSHSI